MGIFIARDALLADTSSLVRPANEEVPLGLGKIANVIATIKFYSPSYFNFQTFIFLLSEIIVVLMFKLTFVIAGGTS